MTPILLERIAIFGIREPVSAISHGVGAVLGVIATVFLVRKALVSGVSPRGRGRLLLYGISVVAAFGASFLFHYFERPAEDLIQLKKLDHAAIFLLIAGTTGALIGLFRRVWTSWMIRVTWLIAVVGIGIKMAVWPMSLWMSATTYLIAGWSGAFGLLLAARASGWQQFRPVVHGSILMTLAALCFVLEQPVLVRGVIEGHEVFHVGVLVGVALHFLFIYRNCGGTLCEPSPESESDDARSREASVHPGVLGEV